MSAGERRFVGAVMRGLADGCRRRQRTALAGLFDDLAGALIRELVARTVELTTAADLDDGEIDDLVRTLEGRQAACRALGGAGESSFYADVVAALDDELTRRRHVLAGIDAAIDWYERYTNL